MEIEEEVRGEVLEFFDDFEKGELIRQLIPKALKEILDHSTSL